jgi:archaellum biogenesis protein FlaJ (TadC family)
MAPSYLTRSRLAWVAVALVIAGFALKFITAIAGWPTWLVPVGYFVALAGAGLLFVGWIIWKAGR